MRQIYIVLIVTFLTLSIVKAQNNHFIYMNVRSDETVESLYETEFINSLSENLKTHDYELIVNSTQFDANVQIEFEVNSNNIYRVSIQPLTPTELSQSSILFAHFRQPYTYEIDIWDQEVEGLITLSTGLALYSIEEYGLALSYLDTAQDTIVTSSLSTGINGNLFISFYAGNCYVELSENTQAHYEYVNSVIGAEYIPLYVNHSWALLQLNSDWVDHYGEERNTILNHNLGIILHPLWKDNLEIEEKLEILSHRAQLYALAFDYDSAIVDIDEAISIAEENDLDNQTLAELYTIRGEIIFLIYEWDRVEDNFDTAIELNPEYDRAYFQRGVLFYTMARREDALADFQTYLNIQPNGIYADEAQSYIESIEIELEALGG